MNSSFTAERNGTAEDQNMDPNVKRNSLRVSPVGPSSIGKNMDILTRSQKKSRLTRQSSRLLPTAPDNEDFHDKPSSSAVVAPNKSNGAEVETPKCKDSDSCKSILVLSEYGEEVKPTKKKTKLTVAARVQKNKSVENGTDSDKGRSTGSFITNLYRMVTDETKKQSLVTGWNDDGCSFFIDIRDDGLPEVIGSYFRHCRYDSLRKALGLYRFLIDISASTDSRKSYFHPLFHRENPHIDEIIENRKKYGGKFRKDTQESLRVTIPKEKVKSAKTNDRPDVTSPTIGVGTSSRGISPSSKLDMHLCNVIIDGKSFTNGYFEDESTGLTSTKQYEPKFENSTLTAKSSPILTDSPTRQKLDKKNDNTSLEVRFELQLEPEHACKKVQETPSGHFKKQNYDASNSMNSDFTPVAVRASNVVSSKAAVLEKSKNERRPFAIRLSSTSMSSCAEPTVQVDCVESADQLKVVPPSNGTSQSWINTPQLCKDTWSKLLKDNGFDKENIFSPKELVSAADVFGSESKPSGYTFFPVAAVETELPEILRLPNSPPFHMNVEFNTEQTPQKIHSKHPGALYAMNRNNFFHSPLVATSAANQVATATTPYASRFIAVKAPRRKDKSPHGTIVSQVHPTPSSDSTVSLGCDITSSRSEFLTETPSGIKVAPLGGQSITIAAFDLSDVTIEKNEAV